jgi:hypothetical protein
VNGVLEQASKELEVYVIPVELTMFSAIFKGGSLYQTFSTWTPVRTKIMPLSRLAMR